MNLRLHLLVPVFFLVHGSLQATDYVEVTGGSVNIRTEAQVNSASIGKGTKGQIFIHLGKSGDWYEISAFSGESRFLHADYSVFLSEEDIQPEHFFSLPEDVTRLRTIYQDVKSAREKARATAESILPSERDLARHERLRTLIEDRDVLKIFKEHNIHPGLLPELEQVAESGGW